MFLFREKTKMIDADRALPGRDRAIPTASSHYVFKKPLKGALPEGVETIYFGMGCFWGAERLFWQLPGVYSTAVGYAGGQTPNPSYEEVCTGLTNHAEVVLVVFDPNRVSYEQLLKAFWEGHNPTQGMRQGNDEGSQYRSTIYAYGDAQLAAAKQSKQLFQEALSKAGRGTITTEIGRASCRERVL